MLTIIQQLSRNLHNKTLACYLLINALLLISLIPGGGIETRDFSHISTLYLTAFNALLTALGMCSLLFIPLAIKNYRAVADVSKILAIAYCAVYLLDLMAIFPQTPSRMPTLLLVIEVVGTFSACLLFFEGHKLHKKFHEISSSAQRVSIKKLSPVCILALVLVGNGVIIFSTYSAINSGN